jgi:hypothetical protein
VVVCGLQPAAAAAKTEDEGVEEKTNKSNLQKNNSEMLMVARLIH